MKFKKLLLLPLLLLSSCDINIEFGTFITSNSTTSSSSNAVNTSVTTAAPTTTNNITNTSITPPSSNVSSTSTSVNVSLTTLTLNNNSIDASNKTLRDYDTGNYGSESTSGIEFNFYRAYREDTATLMDLIPYVGTYNDGSLPGAFYNQTAIYDIRSIEITYHTSGEGLTNPILRFGEDYHCLSSLNFESSKSTTTITQNFDGNVNFFRVESDSYNLTIEKIVIKYTNIASNIHLSKNKAYDENVRINPVTYNSTLVSGTSSVTIPTEINQVGDNYEIVSSKTLTYYSYEDVVANKLLASKAAITSPEDVAAYFIAFKTYPANYVLKRNYSTAKNYFGTATRCVSQYERTDGYATSVPYKYNSDFTYYECDIDLDGTYSSSNRGVGRVVVWMSGFVGDGYDNSPVAVYTDDHYATFAEYFNFGSFGPRFDAEMDVVQAVWSNAKTLTMI